MLLWALRLVFVVVIVGVLVVSVSSEGAVGEEGIKGTNFWALVISGFGMAIFVFLLDVLTPKSKLGALAGVFFGLVVGMLISGALATVVDLIQQSYAIDLDEQAVAAIKWMMGVCICFLTISVVVRTKDDFRFVIPYTEFTKQTKGARPLVLDTSAIIDGRIVDLCQSKLFDAPLLVPRFVLNELQLISDSADRLKRNRGRRGLDILNKMQESTVIDIAIDDTVYPEIEEAKGVDQKITVFSKACNGRLVTTDYNLTKVARVREVDVLNLNDLANSMKVVAIPGETMEVKIIKPGEESDQGIGYLEDGTMVVVEGARDKIGRAVHISITSSLQTSAGKMIFGKFEAFAQNDTGSSQPSRRPHGRKAARTNR